MNETPLTVREVMDRLRCSRNYVHVLFRRGELLGFRLGKDVRIWPSSVSAYVQRQANPAPTSIPKELQDVQARSRARRRQRIPVRQNLRYLRPSPPDTAPRSL